jgi:hypothetical protein
VDKKRRKSQKEREIVGLEVPRVCVHVSARLVPWLTTTTGTSRSAAAREREMLFEDLDQ